MRYWFDTEFFEDGVRIHPISLGMVAEDGRELYLEFKHEHLQHISSWVKENVPKFCLDIQQLRVHVLGTAKGVKGRPQKPDNAHHALADARWNKAYWEALERIRTTESRRVQHGTEH